MRKIDIVICAGLVALIWTVFGQTLSYDFVNYDDRVYVTQAPQVNGGLTTAGIVRAFTHAHADNWHPLTTISHMLDCQLFGLRAGAHHAVNVALHMCAVLLLYGFLRLTTETKWGAAFVAAVFAIHPLRVESVAWIAERKDVLSAAFFMAALIAYARYAQTKSLGRYLTMSILCACALMSKPMLVTLPLVLLIVDFWPLRRSTSIKLVAEKLPLFAMAFAVGLITLAMQRRAPGSLVPLPLWWRIENAVVSYVGYIAQMFWPNDLVVFYPHAEDRLPIWQVLGAAMILLSISCIVFRFRLTKPYLLAGWLWYLVMLLPVIGLVGFGLQGHADRYTYLPQIGLYFAIAWLIVDLARAFRWRREILVVAATIVVLSLGGCAWKQTRYWRNSETLWSHALTISPSDIAHANMGLVLLERGRTDDAIAQLQSALEIRSRNRHPHFNISFALIYTDLALAFAQRGDLDEAARSMREAIQFQPNYPNAHYNLAAILTDKGDFDGAIAEFKKTLELRPDDVEAQVSLATALTHQRHLREAIAHFDAALKIAPRAPIAANNLAWLLAATADDSLRDVRRSLELARIAFDSDPENAFFARTLAVAQAANGNFADARAMTQKALQIAREKDDVDLIRALEGDLEFYAHEQPLRDPGLTNAQ